MPDGGSYQQKPSLKNFLRNLLADDELKVREKVKDMISGYVVRAVQLVIRNRNRKIKQITIIQRDTIRQHKVKHMSVVVSIQTLLKVKWLIEMNTFSC